MLARQPIVNTRTREVESYEVLIRMLDENNQMIMPGGFLPSAVCARHRLRGRRDPHRARPSPARASRRTRDGLAAMARHARRAYRAPSDASARLELNAAGFTEPELRPFAAVQRGVWKPPRTRAWSSTMCTRMGTAAPRR